MILKDGIKLYHASYKIVKKIDLTLCSSGKDFGKGFYLTTDLEQAKRFLKTAISKAIKNNIPDIKPDTGYISIYNFNTEIMKNLNVYEFKSADTKWLHCVAAHRKADLFNDELQKWINFDIIAGKIANDTTNQILTTYINGLYGAIGSEEADQTAIRLLMPEKLSNQICFKTNDSLSTLSFSDYITVKQER